MFFCKMAFQSDRNGCALYGEEDGISKKKVAVVLPAAGTGQRFGTDPPKQFAALLDRPVWSYTVENFLAFKSTHFEIMAIVFVIPPSYRAQVTNDLRKYFNSASCRIRFVHGEATRHRSILVAAKSLENAIDLHVDLIVINDAVRIFFDPQKLESQMQIALECGACGIFVPAVSTSIRVQQEDSLLKEQKPRRVVMAEALPRSLDVVCSEMPQAFRADVFFNMYNKCTDDDLDNGTECLALAQKYVAGVAPKLIAGGDENFKITYPKDLLTAEAMLKKRNESLLSNGCRIGGWRFGFLCSRTFIKDIAMLVALAMLILQASFFVRKFL